MAGQAVWAFRGRPARGPAGGASQEGRRGQATLEYALVYAGILLPLTFAMIFLAELLWVWHSVVEWTRDTANYAATHCWQADGANVQEYARSHLPLMIDRDQFISGQAELMVQYYGRDPETGALVDFTCESGECSTGCVPELVTVRVRNYEFRRFMGFMGLPPVSIPDFRASAPIESAGCSADQEGGVCLP